jgi:hypothetical protein
VTQTQPVVALLRSARVSVYVDSRLALEQDLPCPPLPFVAAGFGLGMRGALAHPQLYAVRLPYLHVAALFVRGPAAGTLHHALSAVLPRGAPPELRRAGLVLHDSLEDMYEGMLLTPAHGGGAGAGGGGARSGKAAKAGGSQATSGCGIRW